MAPQVNVERITPTAARKILAEANIGNRALRPARVETYTRDMLEDRWVFNGDPIRFNGDGRLYDGQHRLAAVVKSGRSQEFAVVRGLSQIAHATIDTGMGRTMAQELSWRGVAHAASVASVLNLVWQYDAGALTDPHIVATRQDLLLLHEREPDIASIVTLTAPISTTTKIRGSALSTGIHLIGREHGARALEFLEELKAGVGYEEGNPCLALRTYATRVAGNRNTRPTTVEWLAVVIKAGNYWLSGSPLRTLKWTRFGRTKEEFPTVLPAEERGEE